MRKTVTFQERIATRAYYLWLTACRNERAAAHGGDWQAAPIASAETYWLQAEKTELYDAAKRSAAARKAAKTRAAKARAAKADARHLAGDAAAHAELDGFINRVFGPANEAATTQH